MVDQLLTEKRINCIETRVDLMSIRLNGFSDKLDEVYENVKRIYDNQQEILVFSQKFGKVLDAFKTFFDNKPADFVKSGTNVEVNSPRVQTEEDSGRNDVQRDLVGSSAVSPAKPECRAQDKGSDSDVQILEDKAVGENATFQTATEKNVTFQTGTEELSDEKRERLLNFVKNARHPAVRNVATSDESTSSSDGSQKVQQKAQHKGFANNATFQTAAGGASGTQNDQAAARKLADVQTETSDSDASSVSQAKITIARPKVVEDQRVASGNVGVVSQKQSDSKEKTKMKHGNGMKKVLNDSDSGSEETTSSESDDSGTGPQMSSKPSAGGDQASKYVVAHGLFR